MSVVINGVNIPKCCDECFCCSYSEFGLPYCRAIKGEPDISFDRNRRRPDCPIQAAKKTLDPHNENVGSVLISAVRYALGRRTYMPSIVVGVTLSVLSELAEQTLCCIERDIIDQERFGYGDDCDKVEWMRLLEAVTAEREKRGLEAWR